VGRIGSGVRVSASFQKKNSRRVLSYGSKKGDYDLGEGCSEGGLISYHDVTSLNACAAAVDGPEVGLSKFSVSELTEPAAESLTVDDAVVRGVSQVDVDATSLALRNVVRHHSVFVIGHRFVSYD